MKRARDFESKYDYIIVGSGFGGSVAALRLSQKGYSVLVLEKGRRYHKEDFPKTNWNIRKYLWAPILKCFGIQEISLLKGVMVLHGSGVGGGSLVYANTLMRPQESVFDQPEWGQSSEWKLQLKDCYHRAEKMLGVTENQILGPADQALEKLSQDWNIDHTYHRTKVGVYFGEVGQEGQEVSDPYFGGQGPRRTGCTGCGGCMIGCRVGAKNTLDQNYLYLAEKLGAKILPDSPVDRIFPQFGQDYRYRVETRNKGYQAKNVILAAGVLGTLKLLFRNRDEYKTLSNISQDLGKNVRTNGESLCGATSFDKSNNFSKGIAIGSAIHPDENIKIEPVRYSQGSDFLRFLAVPLTGAGNMITRPLKMLLTMCFGIASVLRLLLIRDWAKSTVILLVMQTIDQKLNLTYGRCWLHFFQKNLKLDRGSEKIPSYLPVAQHASRDLAKIIGGVPQNIFSEVMLGIPATAHILGGVGVGNDSVSSVIDQNFEVHGYPGLYVCDGSVVPVNLGVNPSLTIAALAEYWANGIKGKR
ncbi:MAG: cholesterol oxidase [Oligoflexia bacterium]|nr:MAG: cholesterol oxidase [Oligoflexia bacterium]